MKMSLLYFLIIGFLLTTVEGFGDVITKDGIKIQVFRRGEKKSVPKRELAPSDIPMGYPVDFGVDKLVFSGKHYDYTGENSYNIRVYNEENNDIILKREDVYFYFDKKIKSYTFPIYPWIHHEGMFKIVVERNNINILEFTFELDNISEVD
jgi:hypothetical protein